MSGWGGARKGGGRKPISEELKSADLSREALVNKYGGLKRGSNCDFRNEQPNTY